VLGPLGDHGNVVLHGRRRHGRDEGTDGGRGEEKPPGLWLEAFTKAVNGVPQERKHGEDSDDAWDKGDLK
ncbi:hypothetical protein PV779_65770, partial [Streptomyces sp. ID01-9D]|nr:hypothetical protein [Streptomyces sp. ID01-9D]